MPYESVAWILGAGFSKALGGPLLNELISDRIRHSLQNIETPPDDSLSCCVTELFEDGRKRGLLWQDAEQFLEMLEIAANNHKSATSTLIASLARTPYEKRFPNSGIDAKGLLVKIHTEAVRFVAGACTSFLSAAEGNPDIVSNSERWEPFVKWAQSLETTDTVITFNYDRSLALLGASETCPRLDFSVPPRVTRIAHEPSPARRSVKAYHMHGSVAWTRASADSERFVDEERAVAHENPERAVLGIPGVGKKALAQGHLKGIWDEALTRLASAKAVVFVGYRFPETDNMAKRALLGALKAQTDSSLHIVLGPNSPDAARLRRMLEWTRPARKDISVITDHQMFAQDFMAVFDRQVLINAKWKP
ncbi:MAG TPA: hypothetical protein VFS41_06165 [Edaphobacter sp.]|nr:hypothetical protein [Edaphobacter sp.]